MAWKCARDSSGAPGGPPRTVYANSSAHNAAFLPNVISNTKYTWWNFVPKNLWEQFARNTNRYFLLIALLQLNPQITPVNPLTTWAPLAVIFMITAVKEGLDDWGRRAQDKLANARLYVAVRGGTRVQVRWARARARARVCACVSES
jgi:phospholipid-translocating ATPase